MSYVFTQNSPYCIIKSSNLSQYWYTKSTKAARSPTFFNELQFHVSISGFFHAIFSVSQFQHTFKFYMEQYTSREELISAIGSNLSPKILILFSKFLKQNPSRKESFSVARYKTPGTNIIGK